MRLLRDYDPSLPEFDRRRRPPHPGGVEPGAQRDRGRRRARSPCARAPNTACASATQLHPLALRLEIADDGRGVPEDLAEQLFLPLVSGRAEGSGLGLALAQQVAREHRGSLAYRSRPGHTVFTLLLPMRTLAEEVDDDASRPPPSASGWSTTTAAVRFVLATALREAGYRVEGFDGAAPRSTRLRDAGAAGPAVHRRAHARRRWPGAAGQAQGRASAAAGDRDVGLHRRRQHRRRVPRRCAGVPVQALRPRRCGRAGRARAAGAGRAAPDERERRPRSADAAGPSAPQLVGDTPAMRALFRASAGWRRRRCRC